MNLQSVVAKLSLAALFTLAGVSPAIAASISFSLDSSLLVTIPGSTVTFSGVVENTGSDPVFLNGISVSAMGGLIVDSSLFFFLPASLLPLEDASGALFRITVPNAAALGLYAGTVSILGGDTASDQDVLASETFAVNVVPEPSSIVLAVGGMAGLGLFRRRRI